MSDAPEQSPQGNFEPTQWTLVAEASDPAHPLHAEALAELLAIYRPALCAHLTRRRGLTLEQADDLLQEFIVRKILQYNLPARADRSRGKFRTLLLTALDNFVRTRSANQEAIATLSENVDPSDDALTPDENFDVPWARQVLHESIRRMRLECHHTGRIDVWDIFECRILAPTLTGAPCVDYETLVLRHKLNTPMQASNILITGKRIFERTLRSVIAQYCRNEDIEAEIVELRHILSKATVE